MKLYIIDEADIMGAMGAIIGAMGPIMGAIIGTMDCTRAHVEIRQSATIRQWVCILSVSENLDKIARVNIFEDLGS